MKAKTKLLLAICTFSEHVITCSCCQETASTKDDAIGMFALKLQAEGWAVVGGAKDAEALCPDCAKGVKLGH